MESGNEDESSGDTRATQADDAADLDFTPKSRGKKYKPSSSQSTKKKSVKKVTLSWTDEETFNLIANVEKEPKLWRTSDSDFKLPKTTLWENVSQAVGVDIDECKAKWSHLRVQFRKNANTLRSKKSGQGADEVNKVQWRFFRSMLFIEAEEAMETTQSGSNMEMVIDLMFDRCYPINDKHFMISYTLFDIFRQMTMRWISMLEKT